MSAAIFCGTISQGAGNVNNSGAARETRPEPVILAARGEILW